MAHFEAECRCRAKQDYCSSNEELLAKLAAAATGHDILVPTGNAVETLVREGALRPAPLPSPCLVTTLSSSPSWGYRRTRGRPSSSRDTSSHIKELTIGNIWVALGYWKDMFQAQQDARRAGRTFDIT